jgi:PAS domain S-box-containing protein
VRASFDSSPLAISFNRPNGTYIGANPAWEELFGRTREEVAGHHFIEYTGEIDLHRAAAVYELLDSGRADTTTFIKQYLRKDGGEILARVTLVALRDRSGRMIAVMTQIQDITESRRNEDRLATNFALLESAQEVGQFGTFVAWLAGDRLGVDERSKVCMEIFGYDLDTYDGTNDAFWRRVHSDDLAMVREAQRVAGEDGSFYDLEHRIVRPDGEVRWIHERGQVEYAGDGSPLRFLGVTRDVTDERIKAAAVLQSEAEFRSAFDFSSVGASMATIDGTWTRVNRALGRVLGTPPELLVGRRLLDFVANPERPRLPSIKAMVAEERDVESFTGKFRHPAGHEITLRVSRSIVRRSDTSPSHVLTQFEDVTAVTSALHELARARAEGEERLRISSTLNHEIRNPLNVISGFLDLLLIPGKDTLSDKQRRYLTNASTASAQLLELVTESLELARLTSVAFGVEAVVIDLRPQLGLLVGQIAPLAAARGSRLSFRCPDGVMVAADPKRLHQVLRNLLANAVKHTPSGSRIVAVARAVGDRIEIDVGDNGEGIPGDRLANIFEEFVQVGPDRSGTGLGLAISRQLTRLMGGELSVASTLDQGTTFTVSLPATLSGIVSSPRRTARAQLPGTS